MIVARVHLWVGFALKGHSFCESEDLRLGTMIESLRKEVSALAEGIVKWFSNKKGYGFIEQDEGPDIFVHYSSIDMPGFKTLRGGDRVSFEVNDSDRGPEANKVKKV